MKLLTRAAALLFAALFLVLVTALLGGVLGLDQARAQAVSTITAAGASAAFPAPKGVPFHVLLLGTASAQCYLERELDGVTWSPITVTAGGSTTILYNWNYTGSTVSEDIGPETQNNVPYRVDCGAQLGSFTSGSLTVKFSW